MDAYEPYYGSTMIESSLENVVSKSGGVATPGLKKPGFEPMLACAQL